MKYPHSKDRGINNIIIYSIAVVFSVGCFYFWYTPITSFVFRVGVSISYPFWSMEDYISNKFASLLINFDSKEELIKNNEYLRKQIESFRYFTTENKFIREENEQLKKLLNRTEGAESETDKKILSYVLSGPVTPPYDNLILDAGSNLNVAVGDMIVTEEGSIMGDIVEVSSKYSKARLLSSYGLKTSVFLGDNKTMIEMIGMGGGNFFIALPNDFKVRDSDIAIYPGLGFKQVAIVSRIEGKEGEMFKNVFLSAPFNIKETRFVGIVKKNN